MKKILFIVVFMICNGASSYASQDRYQFASHGYVILDQQESLRLITRIVSELEREREVLTQTFENIAAIICYIPHTAAKIIDLTMPSYKDSIYANVSK